MSDERFTLADTDRAHAVAAKAFDDWVVRFGDRLPGQAVITHVGATSVPGALTKGDLDIAVRVEAGDFASARNGLDASHTRNLASVRNERFAAYEIEGFDRPVGVQLVVKSSPLDVFDAFREALLDNPVLLAAYNDLKRGSDGQPMAKYRAAKARFITEQLQLGRG